MDGLATTLAAALLALLAMSHTTVVIFREFALVVAVFVFPVALAETLVNVASGAPPLGAPPLGAPPLGTSMTSTLVTLVASLPVTPLLAAPVLSVAPALAMFGIFRIFAMGDAIVFVVSAAFQAFALASTFRFALFDTALVAQPAAMDGLIIIIGVVYAFSFGCPAPASAAADALLGTPTGLA